MARILKRPMFRRGGMPSSEGVAAVRPKYMGGGMSGIMTGINPTAGLTPRVGYKVGTPPLSAVFFIPLLQLPQQEFLQQFHLHQEVKLLKKLEKKLIE